MVGGVRHIEETNAGPAASGVATLSAHVTVELHCSSIEAPDPIVTGRRLGIAILDPVTRWRRVLFILTVRPVRYVRYL